MHDIDNELEVNLDNYQNETQEHEYINELDRIDSSDADKLLDVGVDTKETGRAGTFIQKDKSIIHCKTKLDGVEVMGISRAREIHLSANQVRLLRQMR